MKKIRYTFSLLGMLFFSFFTILLAPFRKPIQEVRQKIHYVRQPCRRMAVFMAAFALLVLFSLMTLPAFAGTTFTATVSMHPTNNLVNGVSYATYPTNANSIATGNAADLDGYKTCGFYFSGFVSNSASVLVWIPLVRSSVTTVSSGGVTNWETTPVYKMAITIPAMTNYFTWVTNLPEDFAGCANQAGASTITNNFASGQSITNLDYGIIKKQVPTKF